MVVTPRFAHQSEAEFAKLLTAYHVRWLYEPCSFPIGRREDGCVREWFTPDFYLPDHDVFVELTVQNPRLNSRKNRKVRLLREYFPDVNITLINKRDFERVFCNRCARAS